MSSNEIAVNEPQQSVDLTVLPPAQTRTAIARQVLRDHAELSQMAYDFACKLVTTEMVPTRFRHKGDEAAAAILYGAELGMGPIAALQNIFAVHGTPGIYARTAQALLEGKGFQFRTVQSTNLVATIYGWKPGSPVILDPDTHQRISPDEVSEFTYEDAEIAGWTPQVREDQTKGGKLIRGTRYEINTNGKLAGNEKYLTQPRQMLWAKAMMEVCRHLSPATLLGIAYSVEELESEHGSEAPASAPAKDTSTLTVEEILSAAPTVANSALQGVVGAPPTDTAQRVAEHQAQGATTSTATVQDDAPAPDQVDPESDPTPPAPPANKGTRASKRETQAKAKTAGAKPKGMTPRVEQALAKANAKAAAPAAEPLDVDTVDDTTDPEPAHRRPHLSMTPNAETVSMTPDAETQAQWADVEAGEAQLAEPSEDPSEQDPTGDDEGWARAEELMDQAAAASDPLDRPIATPDPEPRDTRPADKDQLQELTKCIAAAGFQPTAEGRAAWFGWLSQEVDRTITANNQLMRWEIDQVITNMKADQG